MSTPHIELNDKNLIAPVVLMPGDPLRAKYIANTYLTDVVQFNNVRNMFGFTGYYKGVKVSVMGSGMGMPSIGIYSYELFSEYDVQKIIRIGSCGSYSSDANIYDVILATAAYSESSFARVAFGYEENITYPSEDLNKLIEKAAAKQNCHLIKGSIHSSDVFYRPHGDIFKDVVDKYGCLAVEMESFALFANAKYLGKEAACLLTVSDSFVTKAVTTALERQISFNQMMEIALNSII